MTDNPYREMGKSADLPYANCAECGQAYARHLMNRDGVCPRCLLPVVESRPNPALPENTATRA